MTHFELVKQFMNTFGQTVLTVPTTPTTKLAFLRLDLIKEEIAELDEALRNDDYIEIADAFSDILYVTYGAYAAFGLTPGNIEIYGDLADAKLPSVDVALGVVSRLSNAADTIEALYAVGSIEQVAHRLDVILQDVYDASTAWGIDINACFSEVHSSNMSKACVTHDDAVESIKLRQNDPETASKYADVSVMEVGEYFVIARNDNGKVLKGQGYFEPNLAKLLAKL